MWRWRRTQMFSRGYWILDFSLLATNRPMTSAGRQKDYLSVVFIDGIWIFYGGAWGEISLKLLSSIPSLKLQSRLWSQKRQFLFTISIACWFTDDARKLTPTLHDRQQIIYILLIKLFSLFLISVSASYVPGPIPDSTRSRHAPLYGRLVSEEHLPASHRDVHQVC